MRNLIRQPVVFIGLVLLVFLAVLALTQNHYKFDITIGLLKIKLFPPDLSIEKETDGVIFHVQNKLDSTQIKEFVLIEIEGKQYKIDLSEMDTYDRIPLKLPVGHHPYKLHVETHYLGADGTIWQLFDDSEGVIEVKPGKVFSVRSQMSRKANQIMYRTWLE
jgi:hypothetical protein